MDDACRTEYPVPGALAAPLNPNNSSTWTCFLPGSAPALGTRLGGVDVDKYCSARGEVGGVHGGPAAYPGNNWRCESSDGTLHPVFMPSACELQYHVQHPIAVLENLEDASSWACYKPAPPPCSASGQSLGQRILASLRCGLTKELSAAKCGVAVAGLLLPSTKILKLVKAMRTARALRAVPPRFRKQAKLAYDIYHARFLPHAPRGFRNAQELRTTIGEIRTAAELIQLLPDISRAVNKRDFERIVHDINQFTGLQVCVDGLVRELQA